MADCSWAAHPPLLRAAGPLFHALAERRGRTLPRALAAPFARAVGSLAHGAKSRRALTPLVWVLDQVSSSHHHPPSARKRTRSCTIFL